MILKGTERGGARKLAAHLLNDRDNDHIEVASLKGFAANDLTGAMDEAFFVASATKCQNFLFSLSLNPPQDQDVGIDTLKDAAERAGKALGLDGQPMAIVVHEKNGRRHAHAVWSRIDGDKLKAINLPFFKDRLNALSKELYLENGWELPEGHRQNGWANPLNFSLAEWQQAKRLDLDPRELRQAFQDAWRQSDSGPAFRAALEERGFFLARGDRRGFVALDIYGEAHSVSRMTGAKTKALEERLGSPDRLPSVDQTRLDIRQRVGRKVHQFLQDARLALREQQRPLLEEHKRMIEAQRAERERLQKLQDARRAAENAERQARIRTGIRGLLDLVIGRAANIRRINEREALEGVIRDRDQREAVVMAQLVERRGLQDRIEGLRREQRSTLMQMARAIGRSLSGAHRAPDRQVQQEKPAGRTRDRDFDFGL